MFLNLPFAVSSSVLFITVQYAVYRKSFRTFYVSLYIYIYIKYFNAIVESLYKYLNFYFLVLHSCVQLIHTGDLCINKYCWYENKLVHLLTF